MVYCTEPCRCQGSVFVPKSYSMWHLQRASVSVYSQKGLDMKFVIQRVSHASVAADQEVIGEIGTGFLVLIGVSETDTEETADKLIRKMIGLRIFPDENGKTNLALGDVGGELLLVSQFTLYANCKKGNRPSFIHAGNPKLAEELYEYIIAECKKKLPVVESGRFGADMKVELLNDGPFTIILDSEEL